ncbi:MAG: PAS domain-containing protein [Candidatus Thermoplasmatota archaeon]
MFNLTPLSSLTGITEIQILFTTLFILTLDTYLHLNLSKKNLELSLIPTGILLAGTGLTITNKTVSLLNYPYYIIFTCLLVVVLLDHRLTLMDLDEQTEEETYDIISPVKKKKGFPFSSIKAKIKASSKSNLKTGSIKNFFTKNKTTGGNIEAKSSDELDENIVQIEKQKYKNILSEVNEFKEKSKKYDKIKNNLKQKDKSLKPERKVVIEKPSKKEISQFESNKEKNKVLQDEKEKQEVDIFEEFGKIKQSAALMKRGRIKKINKNFAEMLGYAKDEVIEKNLIDFIEPEGLKNIERYYSDKLIGRQVDKFITVFSKKDNEKVKVLVVDQDLDIKDNQIQLLKVKEI